MLYQLRKTDGELVRSTRTGGPFVYSSLALAQAAVRALRKQHGHLKVEKA